VELGPRQAGPGRGLLPQGADLAGAPGAQKDARVDGGAAGFALRGGGGESRLAGKKRRGLRERHPPGVHPERRDAAAQLKKLMGPPGGL
jgi:hypothetical protein